MNPGSEVGIFLFMAYLHIVYDYEVIILGGGLAGLTAVLHLAKAEKKVLVIEKYRYPKHKVCGEYVSNEVRPYLSQLGVDINVLRPAEIAALQLSTQTGKSIQTPLPLGGFGLSRYAFDKHLYDCAQAAGADFLFDTASDVVHRNGIFTITTQNNGTLTAQVVLGAFGKRSNLDAQLNRAFIKKNSPWLGVKCHYEYDGHPSHLVGLHSFTGGYAGLSKTEKGSVNFCYLASYKSFKKEKDLNAFTNNVVGSNPFLGSFLEKATPLFEKPLTIAQISFRRKSPIENHILLLGDSAGMLHPLCGNGMAMAIHSAKIAVESVLGHLKNPHAPISSLEKRYASLWQHHFQQRIVMGRYLQHILLHKTFSELAIGTVARSQKIVQTLISRTHGKPILN
ncbi:NAD(P)/FAD-dependent oxidoreductase [Allomuricauda sp. SCSIO 65647]|uniref:NAD(P)/FAD-dependent oxidoreductase n=1 Tax=Allomuricauda sp. SCSIO 65647 TaxID=2908843 RepID=UPI001F188A25|nr:NAD(P)/FAD-dependent oxidoreductase [Muricauda sp. SCSIO 65647]UJH67399.1 NAD(P)/FAD-dependent oxidoreductase [Muricauda sp. SCSIO 65647]